MGLLAGQVKEGVADELRGGEVNRLVQFGVPQWAQLMQEHKSTETRAEPQQIVAQRLLSCLQYPVPYLSRLQRI